MNIGYVYGVASAVGYSVASILVRVGQRSRPDDDGVFMSVFVNVVVLGVAAAVVTRPSWDGAAMVSFMVGGVVGTVAGRTSLLRAVRLIGPSRSNAFVTGAPVAAAVGGWIVLNESITALEALGGVIVITGLLWLVRARTAGVGPDRVAVPLSSYLIASGAPLSFGLAFVFRKWGLERFPSSVIGAFVGAATAYAVILLIETLRGKLAERTRSNFTNVSWWFVGAGVATSFALLSQFQSFTYLEAWVVGILQSTQSIWTIGLSLLFLRGDDRINTALVGSVALVVAGVVLISTQA